MQVPALTRRACRRVACVAALSAAGAAPTAAEASRTEITTGQMLGGTHEKRAFYLKRDGGPWLQTYTGPQYLPSAAGALMNFRAANALFDDERRSDDDPESNTDRFIAQLDAYRAHGLQAFTVSLQGGHPGYEGALASAFRSDGSLKDAWMQRAGRVLEAADKRGMVVILTYFYQRQDQVLENADAARRAVVNATDWLIAQDYRNAIIEIANEHQHPGFDHGVIKDNSSIHGIAELIGLARARYDGLGYRQPVTSSIMGLDFDGALKAAADLALVHGNGTHPDADAAGVAALVADPRVRGPVVMNEDHNGDAVTAGNLSSERATATQVLGAGGSWGLMWQPYNQYYPFRWELGSSADINGGSQSSYFHAVLDHIQNLTVVDGATFPSPVPEPEPEPSPQPAPEVLSLTLVDADRDVPVAGFDPIPSGAVLDLSTLPTRHVNLRANLGPAPVDSVRFTSDAGLTSRLENVAPFAFMGDSDGDYYDTWQPEPGTYTVTATPYTLDGAGGTAGIAETLKLVVVE